MSLLEVQTNQKGLKDSNKQTVFEIITGNSYLKLNISYSKLALTLKPGLYLFWSTQLMIQFRPR